MLKESTSLVQSLNLIRSPPPAQFLSLALLPIPIHLFLLQARTPLAAVDQERMRTFVTILYAPEVWATNWSGSECI
jgi:hypothetical protein